MARADRDIALGLADRVPAGKIMIDAVAHPPLDLEAAVAGVEGKFPDGSVVEEMARDDLAAGEGALHPGQGVGLEMPRGIIARGARPVAVAEIHAQLKPRRLRG